MNLRLPFRSRAVPTPAVLASRTPTLRPAPVMAAAPVPSFTPPAAVAAEPLPRFTYRVRFDGGIPDLTAHKVTRRELSAVVVAHVSPYVRASRAVIDEQMPFILVRADDQTVARATFEVLPTGGAQR